MKILDELRFATGFDTWTCLTYCADLAWFESAVLRPLRVRGVRRFLIIADRARISADLDESTQLPDGLGLTYVLHSAASRITFHPKLYLLSGKDRARLYVGSGNLTRSGLDRNLEVFERWDYEGGDSVEEAFLTAGVYIRRILDENGVADDLELDHLDQALRFGRGLEVSREEARLVTSPAALMDQIPFGAPPCSQLRMVAPYYDPEGVAVRQIVERVGATTFDVVFDLRMTDITREAVSTIQSIGGRVFKIRSTAESGGHRPVHGKLLVARGKDWAVGLVGSANLSLAAWRGHNHELVVLRQGAAVAAVEGLIESLPCEPLTDDDLEVLDRSADRRRKESEDGFTVAPGAEPRLQSAWWIAPDRVVVRRDAATTGRFAVDFRGPTERGAGEAVARGAGQWEVAAPPTIRRGVPCLVRLGGETPGPWVAVQDRGELQSYTRDDRRAYEALEELTMSSSFMPEDAFELMTMIAEIYRARLAEQPDEGAADRSSAARVGEDADLRFVSFAESTARAHSTRPQRSADTFSLFSLRLLNRLLFGEDGDVTGDDDWADDDLADEELLARTARASPKKTMDESLAVRVAKFLEESQRAREYYLRTLALRGENPVHLIEHLMLMGGLLHCTLKCGGLGELAFLRELVQLLRGMFGGANTPVVRAIGRLEDAARRDIWRHSPAFGMMMRLLYNACLVDALLEDRSKRVNVRFTNSHPVLWVRHIVRKIAPDLQPVLSAELAEGSSRARGAVFRLDRHWPQAHADAPFDEFVARTVADALALNRLEDQLHRLEATLRERWCGPAEDDVVVTFASGGSIAAGWAEDRAPTQIRSGAFEWPDPPASSHIHRMGHLPIRGVYRLDDIVALADEFEGQIDWDGLDVLDRIARSPG